MSISYSSMKDYTFNATTDFTVFNSIAFDTYQHSMAWGSYMLVVMLLNDNQQAMQ